MGSSEHSNFTVVKSKNYTVMGNHHLRNKKLSLKAKGLLSVMLSVPDTWKHSIMGYASICRDGVDGVRSTIKELEEHGYITRCRKRNEKGHLTTTEYTIYEMMGYDGLEELKNVVYHNIGYEQYKSHKGMDKLERVTEIANIIIEVLCYTQSTINIAGQDYPSNMVKDRFLKLNSFHIDYVLECLDKNTTHVRNIKRYLISALFNAPVTMDNYYTALVNHNLYGPPE